MLGFLFLLYTRKPKSKPAAHEMDEYDNFAIKNEFIVIDQKFNLKIPNISK